MALSILDLPTMSDGTRAYLVGRVELRVTTSGDRTRVASVTGTPVAVEGFWLNDTEAIEAFHGEFPLF